MLRTMLGHGASADPLPDVAPVGWIPDDATLTLDFMLCSVRGDSPVAISSVADKILALLRAMPSTAHQRSRPGYRRCSTSRRTSATPLVLCGIACVRDAATGFTSSWRGCEHRSAANGAGRRVCVFVPVVTSVPPAAAPA
jgi:hypothetical protein